MPSIVGTWKPRGGLSLADLAVAGAVFFMCLPDPAAASYPHVLAVFVVALTAGIISHVPGGLGVFETIILVGLSNEVPGDRILAALLVFRVMYFSHPARHSVRVVRWS